MQCPTCGRTVEFLLDGSCAVCASQRLPLLEAPEVVDAVLCAHCGRLESGATWRPVPKDRDAQPTEVVRPKLRADPRMEGATWAFNPAWEDERNGILDVRLSGRLAGEPVERARAVRFRFKTGACPDCSREMGGYFEAIIQVRGAPGADLEGQLPLVEDAIVRRVASLRAEQRPNSFIQKTERRRHGNDYYIGNKEEARQIAKELADLSGAETAESTKLVGRRDGRDLYRWTHLVRLPAFGRGDFVLVDGSPFKVLQFDRKQLQLLDLVRQVRVRRDRGRTELKVIGRSSDEKPAVVVSRSGGQAQVLDPVTLRTVDVPGASVPTGRGEVPVFRFEDTLYVVAESPG